MSAWKRIALAALMILLPSCSTNMAQRRPYLIMENMDNAARCVERGETEEAAQIYQVVLLADPFNEEAKAELAHIGQYDRCVLEPSILGKNLVAAPKRKSPLLAVLLYPVNRVLDVFDVVSFHVGAEGGLYFDAHATRAMQVSMGGGGGTQLGWWQKRELAAGVGHVGGMALIPFSLEGEGYTRVGTRGARSTAFSTVGLNRPSDHVYQRHRDYWGVGTRAVVGIVGAGIEVHPVEIADAVCGFFFVDFLRDDVGQTRSQRLNRPAVEAMEDLIGTLSPSELRARMRDRAIPAVESTRTGNMAEDGKRSDRDEQAALGSGDSADASRDAVLTTLGRHRYDMNLADDTTLL